MNKEESIRQFADTVDWFTAENVCYLLEGNLDPKRKHYWETKLFYYMCHRKDPRKRIKHLHTATQIHFAVKDEFKKGFALQAMECLKVPYLFL